jgi:hypothetical protein
MKAGDYVWHVTSMDKADADRPLGVIIHKTTKEYEGGTQVVSFHVSFCSAQPSYVSATAGDFGASELVPLPPAKVERIKKLPPAA